MNAPVFLALLSIPFAAIFINSSENNGDVYIITYITALAFIIGLTFLLGGHHIIPLSSVIADPMVRQIP